MEFDFPIQDVLKHEITFIDGSLTPNGTEEEDQNSFQECQRKVSIILDKIGVSSAIAQELQVPVTSSERLKNTEHRVYLLSDFSAGKNGIVIGLLKVGNKKLYVFDQTGRQHELNPLCVLDFYVHESQQRHGCGKRLYDYMLQAEGVKTGHLAFDRPSDKLLSFLAKHYNLYSMIPQSNNFVVYDTFFDGRNGDGGDFHKRSTSFHAERPAAGFGTSATHRDINSRRGLVINRPHSSISKIMDANGAVYRSGMDGDVGDSGNSLDHVSPLQSPTHSYSARSCSSATESIAPHKDIKFQHQRLW